MFCHVPVSNVIAVHDCESLYHVPLLMRKQGIIDILQQKLKLTPKEVPENNEFFKKWVALTERINKLHDTVEVVLVGKYTHLKDSYISVAKSLQHAALACNRKLVLNVSFLL